MITSHPSNARYYGSREQARKDGGKVYRLGWFANGSFGVYARLKSNGQYVGGVNPLVCVWMAC